MKIKNQLGSKPGGFSLIELMIAMTLGLAVVAAVTTLSLNSIRSYRAINQANQQLENGRYALLILKSDLEHAGHYGGVSPLTMSLPGADFNDPCDLKPQTHANNLLLPIRGYDFISPPVSNLFSSSNCETRLTWIRNNTSILVIRRADTDSFTWNKTTGNWYDSAGNTPTAGNTYIQSAPDQYAIACIGCSESSEFKSASNRTAIGLSLRRPDDETYLADIRRYHVHIYYIRDSSNSSVKDNIPTLVRISLSNYASSPSMTTEPLVEGIEDMQIQYGLDAPLGTACPLSALPANCDGAPDLYVTASQIPTNNWRDWANVVTVRVNLLARSLETSPGYTDNKSYDLGTGTLISPTDKRYPRHVFSQVLRIHHTGGWRDREK